MRDELLDQAVGKCVPIETDGWGNCMTHRVGWAPGAFENGRCWAVQDRIRTVDATLTYLRGKVKALRSRPIATFDGYTGMVALDQVLVLIDGNSDEQN